jgi:hypothetical protein
MLLNKGVTAADQLPTLINKEACKIWRGFLGTVSDKQKGSSATLAASHWMVLCLIGTGILECFLVVVGDKKDDTVALRWASKKDELGNLSLTCRIERLWDVIPVFSANTK